MKGNKIVLPDCLRLRAFKLAHNDAHQGIVRTKQRMREIYWLPGMDKYIEQAIRNCVLCAIHDKTAKPVVEPISVTPCATKVWHRNRLIAFHEDGKPEELAEVGDSDVLQEGDDDQEDQEEVMDQEPSIPNRKRIRSAEPSLESPEKKKPNKSEDSEMECRYPSSDEEL